MTTERRQKGIYIGAPACFALDMAVRPVVQAFEALGCYVVGSALERPDWRDVDVRLMMTDDAFAREFPDAHDGLWELDPRWLLLTVAISAHLSKLTGLPVDFQFQPQTHANTRHSGQRQAIGLTLSPRRAVDE